MTITVASREPGKLWPPKGWPKNFPRSWFDCIDRKGYFVKKGTVYKKVPESGRVHDNARRLAWNLKNIEEELQAKYGADKRLSTNSAWRPLPYNRKVKSKDTSEHPKGTAADLKCKGVSTKNLHKTIIRLIKEGRIDSGGVGFYPRSGFVHYDIRGKNARWRQKG